MAGKNLLAPEPSSGRNLLADQGDSLAGQIPGQSEETLRAAANLPPEKRVVTKSPFETGLEAMAAVPILGGGARLDNLDCVLTQDLHLMLPVLLTSLFRRLAEN